MKCGEYAYLKELFQGLDICKSQFSAHNLLGTHKIVADVIIATAEGV